MRQSHAGKQILLAVLPALLVLLNGCRSFIIPPCDAPVDMVLAGDNWFPERHLEELTGISTNRLITVPSFDIDGSPTGPSYGTWTTDNWVFGYCGRQRAVLQLPRESESAGWGSQRFKSLNWPVITAGKRRAENQGYHFDAGGNILVSPPVGTLYPFGRIITSLQMQPALLDFLRAQKVQASPDGELIELDTAWLKVGHVDEIVTFVPDKSGGFRILLPDAEAGLKLLTTVDPDRAIFAADHGTQLVGTVTAGGARFLEDSTRDFSGTTWKYIRIISGRGAGLIARVYKADGHRLIIDNSWDLRGKSPASALRDAREGRIDSMPIWFEPPDKTSRYLAVSDSQMWKDGRGDEFPALMTAGELASDPYMTSSSGSFATRIFGPGGVAGITTKGLGLTGKDIVRIPVLIYDDGRGTGAVALAPNPINLFLIDDRVILLKPFGPRENPADESSDVFLRAWAGIFADLGVKPRYIDGWNALHRLDGGARCGVNAVRSPGIFPLVR